MNNEIIPKNEKKIWNESDGTNEFARCKRVVVVVYIYE